MKRGVPGTGLGSALPVDVQPVAPIAATAVDDTVAYSLHEDCAVAHSEMPVLHAQQCVQASMAHATATRFVSSLAPLSPDAAATTAVLPSRSMAGRQQAAPNYNHAAYEDTLALSSTAPAPEYLEAGFSDEFSPSDLRSLHSQLSTPGSRSVSYTAPDVAIQPQRFSRQAEQRCTLATPLYGHEHVAKPRRSPPRPNVVAVVTRAPQASTRASETAWRR